MTSVKRPDPTGLESPVDRVALLIEASALLGSLDYERSLAQVGSLIVPRVADWWVADLLEEDGSLRRVVTRGPIDEPELGGRYPPWPDAPSGPFLVLRTRRPQFVGRITDPAQMAASRQPEHLEALRRLGATSVICVPIHCRGGDIGTMTFAKTSGTFRPLHIALARTLGHRVGQSVMNGRLYQAAQDSNRKKDEFLAMLGHELRNPLGAISNAVAILQSGKVPRDTEGSVQAIISRQLRHLRKLVDDLLDVARLTSGKITIRPVPIDLRTVVDRCVATIHSAGKGENHDIRVEGGPALVLGDPVRLEQVVDNLVDNSVKYTPPGGQIRISVNSTDREATVTVRDTGVGIGGDLLPRVFELFTQAPQGADRRLGGLGIGLAIVKAIVELHDGTVHAQSSGLGRGTDVTVRLPLAPARLGEPRPSEEAPARSDRRYRVLIVEDNDDARETLRILLELNGHHVELAPDGLTGLDLALRTQPDVALIDLGLPGLDGFDLARRVRATPGGSAIRLIAVTGYSQPQDRRRAREAGFESFLVKPVDSRALEGAIHAS